MCKWISVEDKLPRNTEFVLVWGSHSMPWLCEFVDYQFKDVEDGETLLGITHWIPLPKPPKEVQNG